MQNKRQVNMVLKKIILETALCVKEKEIQTYREV